MGCYDTFVIKKPLICPKCGKEVVDVQSKVFGCNLNEYKPGDKILGEEIPGENCIITCNLFCDNLCDNVFCIIVIEDGIYKNIYLAEGTLLDDKYSLKYSIDKYYREDDI